MQRGEAAVFTICGSAMPAQPDRTGQTDARHVDGAMPVAVSARVLGIVDNIHPPAMQD